MTLWETQELEEAAAAAQWERLNEETASQTDEQEQNAVLIEDALQSLGTAINLFDESANWVYQAEQDLDENPVADQLGAIVAEMDKVLERLKQVKEIIKKEVRE